MQTETEKSAINMLGNGDAETQIKSRLHKLVTGLKSQKVERVETPESPKFEADDFIGQALFWLGMARREQDQTLKNHYMRNALEKIQLAYASLSTQLKNTPKIETRTVKDEI